MIGDTIIDSEGNEFEVVWSGGDGLLAPRESRPSIFWTAPKRLYNKKKKEFWDTRSTAVLDNQVGSEESDDNGAVDK